MSMQEINELKSQDLDRLLDKSWNIRKQIFPPTLTISTPSAKTYISDYHKNKNSAFVNISVTGNSCALNCEHCKRTLLENMVHVNNADELKSLGDQLVKKGCEGVLVSGGALSTGEVPLNKYFDAIAYLKDRGLKVLVHSGLATKETAMGLKKAGVDQVLLDIIGDKETINKVYHLDKKPSDFLKSLQLLINEGLDAIPHILIGLHFGKIVGEYHALDIVTTAKPNTIVMVVLSPKIGTSMEGIATPNAEEVGKIIAIARILNPNAHITLGCARPPGEEKYLMEKNRK